VWPEDRGILGQWRSFKQHILHRLRDETYIEGNGITRELIASRLAALQFEIYGKKKIDITNAPMAPISSKSTWRQETRPDRPAAKRFGDSYVYMNE
jgi:hypothetical protein